MRGSFFIILDWWPVYNRLFSFLFGDFSIVSIHKIIQEAFIYETISRRNYWRHRHGRTEICFFVGKPSLVYSNRVSGQLPFCRKKSYQEAVGNRWAMATPIPAAMKDMIILDAQKDVDKVTALVDFVFCAVDMKKRMKSGRWKKCTQKAECPVMSNNSAHRSTSDVPMIIPEINADHAKIIPAQRKRLGTKKMALFL